MARTLPKSRAGGNDGIAPLPSIGDIPLYDADIQQEEVSSQRRGAGGADSQRRRRRHCDAGITIPFPAAEECHRLYPSALSSRWRVSPFIRPVQWGGGGARYRYHLRQILVFLDAVVMNKPEFMGGVIQNKVDPQTGEWWIENV